MSQPAAFGPPPSGSSTSGLAIASLICGIVSLPAACCCTLVAMPLGVAALIMGIVAIRQANAAPGQLGGKGMAIAGVVLGGLSLASAVLALALGLGSYLMQPETMGGLRQMLQQGTPVQPGP